MTGSPRRRENAFLLWACACACAAYAASAGALWSMAERALDRLLR